MNRTIRFILFTGILLYLCVWSMPAVANNRSDKFREAYNALATQEGNIVVSGVVISSTDNLPIPGVAVYVKGNTSIGTASDLDGRYSLTIPEGTKSVIFESLGYDRKEISVKDYLLFTLVQMVEQSNELDEVVVVGFGTQKKESIVGAVQSVKSENLSTPSSVLSTSFAGNVGGLISYQRSGEPGSDGATFYIRGISTFGSGASALIVIDDLESNTATLNALPADAIESFSVLKDATATALYGSRGANGVIVIRTKEGRQSEKMKVNVSVQNTFAMPLSVQEMAGGVDYMNAYNEAVYNEAVYAARATGGELNYTPFYSDEKIYGTANKLNKYIFPDNDWYNMMFKNLALKQRANISIQGGLKFLSYFVSAQIENEGGFTKSPSETPLDIHENFQTYTIQSNISANITKTTKVSLKLNTTIKHKNQPYTSPTDLYAYTRTVNPVRFPAVLPAQDGDTYVRYGNNYSWDSGSNETNPYALMSRGYSTNYYHYVNTIFSIDQDFKFITPGLKATVMAGFYNYTWAYVSRVTTPYYFIVDDYWLDANGDYQYSTSSIGSEGSTYLSNGIDRTGNHRWDFQAKINYDRTFGRHTVTADIIYHMRESLNNATSTDEEDILPERQQGIAGRVTYDFDKRYFIEGDFGYNGSENFMRGHRWGFFPSVAIGWNIANEPFFEKANNVVQNLKIRASYGLTGNDTLSERFPYLTEVSTSTHSTYFGTQFTSYGSGRVRSYGNEDATWETSRKFDVGFDLTLFNSLDITADYFYEYRDNIFMQRTSIASVAGLDSSTPYGNMGVCDNRGTDFSITYNKQFNKDLTLQLRANFTYAHMRVLALDEPNYGEELKNLSKVGHTTNSHQTLICAGIFTSQEEIDNWPKQDFGDYTIGDLKYVDVTGDGVVDDNDYIWDDKPSVPEIVYGFGGTLRYKNWDLQLFFQGDARTWVRMNTIYPFGTASSHGYGIFQWIVDDHWSENNNVADAAYPRLTTERTINNDETSTYWIRNASFLRLKNAEIGYTYNFLRVYVQGTNLFTITPFKYWDPEMGSGNGLGYPLTRTVTIGLQFTF